jgi:hypothetical protein
LFKEIQWGFDPFSPAFQSRGGNSRAMAKATPGQKVPQSNMQPQWQSNLQVRVDDGIWP